MADPLSPTATTSSTANFFGRTSSLFNKRSRATLAAFNGTVAEEEEEGQEKRQDEQATPNASVTSLTSSNGDSSNPRRSLSLRSHQSQNSGSLQVTKKARSPSVALPSTFSPPSPQNQSRSHRLSRSFSAGVPSASRHQPQKSQDESHRGSSPLKKHITPPNASASQTVPKVPLHTLAHTFMPASRRPSEAPSSFSHGSGLALGPAMTMMAPAAGTQSGFSPIATYNHISDTCSKRMATLEYMRKIHEGNVFYFGTMSYSSSQLSTVPSLHPSKLGRRATNYLLLGTSLPPLLEMHSSNPVDFLRALSSLLSEYDTYCSLSTSESGVGSLGRGRMGQMLKSGMRNVKSGRRTSSGTDSLMSLDNASANGSISNLSSITDAMPLPPISNAHDFQHLLLPSLPFDPDFGATFATLTDVLIEAYASLQQLLPGPDSVIPGLAEAFAKADKQLKKIMMNGTMNEFADSARKDCRAEIGGIGKLVLAGLM